MNICPLTMVASQMYVATCVRQVVETGSGKGHIWGTGNWNWKFKSKTTHPKKTEVFKQRTALKSYWAEYKYFSSS